MKSRSLNLSDGQPYADALLHCLSFLMFLLALAVLATAIDFAAATVYWSQYGVTPAQVLRSIASWVLGPRPPATVAVMVVGLCAHLLIYLVMAAVFALLLATRRFPPRPGFVIGSLYGVVAYVVVYQLLVPALVLPVVLDRSVSWVVTCLAVHGLVIGPLLASSLGGRRMRTG